MLAEAKPDVIILHPGPMNRGIEIASGVADGPYSVMMNQVANGVAMRMAVLYQLIVPGAEGIRGSALEERSVEPVPVPAARRRRGARMSERHRTAPRRILVRGGHVIDPASRLQTRLADLLIEGDRDRRARRSGANSRSITPRSSTRAGCASCPGSSTCTCTCASRATSTRRRSRPDALAAVVGGVTSVACMANTNPVNDNGAVTRYIIEKAQLAGSRQRLSDRRRLGRSAGQAPGRVRRDVRSRDRRGLRRRHADHGREPHASGARVRAHVRASPSSCTRKTRTLCCGGAMNEGVVSAQLGLPGLPSVGESAMVARDVELARYTRGRLHVAHFRPPSRSRSFAAPRHDGLSVHRRGGTASLHAR